jgi:ATPase family associated with various cellular activities (AAA)
VTEIDIEKLRDLRNRAETLLGTLVSDLEPFRHKVLENGFVRKPDSDSDPDDVNVTTTCSCLLALALSNKFRNLYGEKYSETASQIFEKLFEAPWMSSGLSENNAFTTTLVIRTFGFLVESEIFKSGNANSFTRLWEPHLQINNVSSFASELSNSNPVSQYIFSLFSRKLQKAISNYKTSDHSNKLSLLLRQELEKIISTTAIYEKNRFAKTKLGPETKKIIAGNPDGYATARLNRLLIHDHYSKNLAGLKKRSLMGIASKMSDDILRFKINDYPPASAVIYWFVDGISRARISLSKDQWAKLCNQAILEFNHERSLVLAGHEAMMDPVAMAMAACLCSRLRELSEKEGSLGLDAKFKELLPSRTELEHSIKELFSRQTNGIWPKYFPLFHYQDAGSNFCFTFELLEAVLVEFGRSENELFDDVVFIKGLEDAVTWCENNRLNSFGNGKIHQGWNSGGNLQTLKKEQPESWATAVVHMFLWELSRVLSSRIQTRILSEYKGRFLDEKKSTINSLIDIEILEKKKSKSLNTLLTQDFIQKHRHENAYSLFKRKLEQPRSALLFGPPGTSKTKVTEAIAGELRWPLIQIDPSHFLQRGLDGIYLQSDKIFKDLMDLSGVVVLFDEMDALVQTRDSAMKLDTVAQFLTTYMLPKLTALHDQGQVVFIMATNFQERFDAAIKRAGRFDLLLCMGPPILEAKLSSLHLFLGQKTPTPKTEEAVKLLKGLCASEHKAKVQLELYTYGEFVSFVKSLASGKGDKGLVEKLKRTNSSDFGEIVKQDAQDVVLRTSDLEILNSKKVVGLSDYKSLADLDKLGIDRKTFDPKEEVPHIIRYLLDRRESKRQF